LILDGDTVPVVVISAGAALTALGQQRLLGSEMGDISNYLEDDNRDFPGVPGGGMPTDECFVSAASGPFNDLLCAPALTCRLWTRARVVP
jgi:hypothetical protein